MVERITDDMVEAMTEVAIDGPGYVSFYPSLHDCRRLLAAALQHQASLPVEAGWQTIETAPKDGKRVDLWVRPWDAFANGNPARITDAWFEDGEWKRVIAGWPHNVSSCGEATHWMPIAAAPSTGGR